MITLTRKPNWRTAMMAALDNHRKVPAEWGEHDCGILAGDSVLAVTGFDPAQEFRGKYHNEQEARALLEAHGCKDHVEYLRRFLPEKPVPNLAVGDIAVMKFGTWFGYGMGVVIGDRIACITLKGLGTVDLTEAKWGLAVG